MSRHVIEVPSYRDVTDRKRLVRRAAKALDISGAFAVEAVIPQGDGAQIVLTTDAPDPRVGSSRQPLSPSVKASDGERVQAMVGRLTGQAMVAFDPHGHSSVVQHAPALDLAVRNAVAAALKKPPWEVRLWVESNVDGDVERVHVARAPAGVTRDQLGEALLAGLAEFDLDIPQHAEWVIARRTEAQKGFVAHARVDPLREIAMYPEGLVPTYKKIPFGINEHGDPVTLGLLEQNLLVGGIPGGGKSGAVTTLLRGVSQLEHTAILGLDPKLVEQAEWAPRFTATVHTPADVIELLTKVETEMLRRYAWLKEQQGVKKFSADLLSEEFPMLVIVVDELADLVSGATEKEDKAIEAAIAGKLRRLVALGRAAAVVVWAATQKPASEVIPTSLRDLIAQRVGYATTNSAMTDTILGAGASQVGGLCHEIPAAMRGVCYVKGETDRHPVRARTYWVKDDDVDDLATRTAHLRVPLPWLTGEAGSTISPEDLDVMLDDLELSLDDLDGADPISVRLRELNGDVEDEPLLPI
ncbi:DNA segregation ATPase, FtsK/SpoIIIE family [Sanguibacter keddieii DSM 10542]|uniref:DNA segregation ATPase, FtsK/SpoIIIE family n=1 Tax=Sanguibacter keddieii (strain ATCC 51767 / DSM 10542 / NCFB 3025 / ST-74) TaxID=446469 RepID=D1BBM7_SANKS|nr:FtsK/SpoIIIE domain-containing protein [Sanguibacter keddieii]ACZ22798.1 DNA segregation ATPase, FtsK/SpoIIIE family [Sanguibacter keddieii DSM 10542]